MSDSEHEPFEAELRKLAPARPPAELMRKLGAASRSGRAQVPQSSALTPRASWWFVLRWLVPAAAVSAIALAWLVWQSLAPEPVRHDKARAVATDPGHKADDVEFDQRLVASFDAVARLPSGQPVRFRCREWADALVVRDPASGIVIEQRTPRLEVVPVSLEIY